MLIVLLISCQTCDIVIQYFQVVASAGRDPANLPRNLPGICMYFNVLLYYS
jgi:hypothetical protein